MNTSILSLLFFVPLITTVILIFILCPYAKKLGFIDTPCSRKQHTSPTPPIGGIVIYLSTLLTLLIYDINLPHQTAFIAAVSLLVLVGAIDDHKEISVKIRLVSQIIAALIMTEYGDIKINDVGDLFGHGTLHLGKYTTLMTVFAVVGGINAFNMIDGIDGLSGSSALISISLVALLAVFFNNPLLLKLSLVFMGAIMAFLAFNLRIFGRQKGSIFLGDSGSTLLGFVVCWLIISASQGVDRMISPTLVLWLIAIPLCDSVCIMMRRLQKRKSPFSPDREHLHHVLPMKGFSTNQTLAIILAMSLLLAVFALTASLFFELPDKLSFAAFLTFFSVFYWAMHNTISAD
jgi:UDP-GlcNAc:undecaprenyl-phosphate GlcNAc-1-phosphate transferase